MARSVVFTLLSQDVALNGLGINATSLKAASAVESPQVRPWAVMKWIDTLPAYGLTAASPLQLWVYDEPGSYTRINDILSRARTILCNENVGVTVGTDYFATANWQGDSAELYDDIYKCITRYASFNIVG